MQKSIKVIFLVRYWSVCFVPVGIRLMASVGGLALLVVDGHLGGEDVGCKEGQLIDAAVEGETERQLFVVAAFISYSRAKALVKLSTVVGSLGRTEWSHDDEHLILLSSLGSLGEQQVIRPGSNGLIMVLEELHLAANSLCELLVCCTVSSLVGGCVSEFGRLAVNGVLTTLQRKLEEVNLDEVEPVVVQFDLAAITVILGSQEDPYGGIYILGRNDIQADGEWQVVQASLAG